MGKGKQFKRLRAHVNPLSLIEGYEYPQTPQHADWPSLYPNLDDAAAPQFADVGCGFGGLLEALAPRFPDKRVLGMEIREQVVDRVKERIERLQKTDSVRFNNISIVRTNAMKFFVRWFPRGQLEKIFFCFPDPHFKKSNFRRRIVSGHLLDEYAYCLASGGMIYTITDVLDLHQWMVMHLEQHPLFERVSEEDLVDDQAVPALYETDESNKVSRLGGNKYLAVFKRK